MIETRWHPVPLACPVCNGEVVITAVCVSADGELKIELQCETCKKPLQWVSHFTRMQHAALLGDIEESQEREKHKPRQKLLTAGPIRPPVKGQEQKNDAAWLHELGIGE